jgi:hypothetical protein
VRLARLSVQSLRTRLACFFAALIAVVLLGFAGAVYLAAAVLEEREAEPQAEKDRELREVRRLLWLSLGMGIPLGAGAGGAGQCADDTPDAAGARGHRPFCQ